MRSGHAPVMAAAGCLLRLRERRADHDRVRATRKRFAHIATGAHAPVGDDRHVASGAPRECVTRGGAIHGRGYLRHADAEDLATRTRRARPDADQQASNAGFHQLERRGIADTVADDDRYADTTAEAAEVERGHPVMRSETFGGDRGLDNEEV